MAADAHPTSWPAGEGEMARRIRAYDWAATPLGPSEAWPSTLRAAVELMLAMPQLASIAVGPERILLYNDLAARHYGARHPSTLGRSIAASFADQWAPIASFYDQAFAGNSLRVPAQPVDSAGTGVPDVYDAYLTPVRGGDGRVLAAFSTFVAAGDRVRAEAALRVSEERQAFLLDLSDRLRPLADPVEVMATASEALGRRLAVGRAGYGEVDPENEWFIVERDWTDGVMPSIAGRHRVADFGPDIVEAQRSDRALVIDDALADARFQGHEAAFEAIRVRASLVVPLLKEGRWGAGFYAQHSSPRRWTSEDEALVREVAERTWAAAERARAEAALRESEERFRSFAEASSDALWIVDAATGRLEYLSPAFEAIWGEERERVMADVGRWGEMVLPEDRPGPGEGIDALLAGGPPRVVEYRIRRRDGALRHVHDTGFAIRDVGGGVRRVAGIAQDFTDRRRAEVALAASERRLRTLLEGIPQLVWSAVDGGRWTWASPQWSDYTGLGQEESTGLGWLKAVHPDDHAAVMAAWAGAEARGGFDAEYRLRHAAENRHRWFSTRALPVRDEAKGAVAEWLGTSTEVDELRALQERQRVLVAELQHRTRNLVGVVRSVADRTLDGSASLPEFRTRFRARLDALARVNALLSRLDEGERIAFDALLRTELAAHGVMDGDVQGKQVRLSGPLGVRLRSSTVQTFALALHELATNALKHGALSRPEGRLALSWSVLPDGEDGPRLRVDWRESGVASAPAPVRQGYGRELIERALPYQLGAETSYALGPDGVRCTITLPLSATADRGPAPGGAHEA